MAMFFFDAALTKTILSMLKNQFAENSKPVHLTLQDNEGHKKMEWNGVSDTIRRFVFGIYERDQIQLREPAFFEVITAPLAPPATPVPEEEVPPEEHCEDPVPAHGSSAEMRARFSRVQDRKAKEGAMKAKKKKYSNAKKSKPASKEDKKPGLR